MVEKNPPIQERIVQQERVEKLEERFRGLLGKVVPEVLSLAERFRDGERLSSEQLDTINDNEPSLQELYESFRDLYSEVSEFLADPTVKDASVREMAQSLFGIVSDKLGEYSSLYSAVVKLFPSENRIKERAGQVLQEKGIADESVREIAVGFVADVVNDFRSAIKNILKESDDEKDALKQEIDRLNQEIARLSGGAAAATAAPDTTTPPVPTPVELRVPVVNIRPIPDAQPAPEPITITPVAAPDVVVATPDVATPPVTTPDVTPTPDATPAIPAPDAAPAAATPDVTHVDTSTQELEVQPVVPTRLEQLKQLTRQQAAQGTTIRIAAIDFVRLSQDDKKALFADVRTNTDAKIASQFERTAIKEGNEKMAAIKKAANRFMTEAQKVGQKEGFNLNADKIADLLKKKNPVKEVNNVDMWALMALAEFAQRMGWITDVLNAGTNTDLDRKVSALDNSLSELRTREWSGPAAGWENHLRDFFIAYRDMFRAFFDRRRAAMNTQSQPASPRPEPIPSVDAQLARPAQAVVAQAAESQPAPVGAATPAPEATPATPEVNLSHDQVMAKFGVTSADLASGNENFADLGIALLKKADPARGLSGIDASARPLIIGLMKRGRDEDWSALNSFAKRMR